MSLWRGCAFTSFPIFLIFRYLSKGMAELFSKDLLNKFRYMAEKKKGL